MRLQGVDLRVPDLAAAAGFFERPWGLARAGGSDFRGTGGHPSILSLAEGPPAVRSVTFACTPAELERTGSEIAGPEGQVYRFVSEAEVAPLPPDPDRPIRITHVVLNVADLDAAERFAVEVLGFQVSDRTGHMRFLRCNHAHHSVAYAQAGVSSLHHIAFEMPDLEAVMRGIGRMRDAGFPCLWGPGRHGPGNNVFGYFIGPHGGVVEYTAELLEVGDDYRVGGPGDWQWPPGRMDYWGVTAKDARLAAAERVYRWSR